jgi:flavodoxin
MKNIGIVIYSQTGNTKSVAGQLQEKLLASGHGADIIPLQVVGEVKPGMKDIQFHSLPGVEQYDVLVFGSPVQAFSLSSVMSSYLSQVDSLKRKNVALLVTQFFPYPFMGGNQAMSRMKQICEEKGAQVCGSQIINWSKRSRDQNIVKSVELLVNNISEVIKN